MCFYYISGKENGFVTTTPWITSNFYRAGLFRKPKTGSWTGLMNVVYRIVVVDLSLPPISSSGSDRFPVDYTKHIHF
jgi:hypothetical protein